MHATGQLKQVKQNKCFVVIRLEAEQWRLHSLLLDDPLAIQMLCQTLRHNGCCGH